MMGVRIGGGEGGGGEGEGEGDGREGSGRGCGMHTLRENPDGGDESGVGATRESETGNGTLRC